MIKIQLTPINYYRALGWLMTHHKNIKWKSDPLNHTVSLPNTKEALIVAMKFS